MRFALLFLFTLILFSGAAFPGKEWHEPIPLLLSRDQATIVIPLTRSWKVLSLADGALSASNDPIGTKLSVQILNVAGQLRTIVQNMFPPGSCSSMQARVLTVGQTEIEETSCEIKSPYPAIELGRFFFENGDLISIESQTEPDKFPLVADEIWLILRGIHPQSGLASAPVQQGEKLYQSPDGLYQLTYPEEWQEQVTGKTLLLYLPKGPSIQVIPATDQLLGNDPKIVFLSFQESLSYSLKEFKLESRDTIRVNGVDQPRITYTYLLPTGEEERAWAIFFNFRKSAYLFVCASPASGFEKDAHTFASAMQSFQVK